MSNSIMPKLDRQTVVRNDGSIDRGASVKANLKEAGKNLADMVRPNHFTDTWNGDKGSDFMFGPALTVVAAPYLVVAELYDVVAGPVKAAKNTVDAVAHGVGAALDKVF